jgi:hypothetical protein
VKKLAIVLAVLLAIYLAVGEQEIRKIMGEKHRSTSHRSAPMIMRTM